MYIFMFTVAGQLFFFSQWLKSNIEWFISSDLLLPFPSWSSCQIRQSQCRKFLPCLGQDAGNTTSLITFHVLVCRRRRWVKKLPSSIMATEGTPRNTSWGCQGGEKIPKILICWTSRLGVTGRLIAVLQFCQTTRPVRHPVVHFQARRRKSVKNYKYKQIHDMMNQKSFSVSNKILQYN